MCPRYIRLGDMHQSCLMAWEQNRGCVSERYSPAYWMIYMPRAVHIVEVSASKKLIQWWRGADSEKTRERKDRVIIYRVPRIM